MGDLAEGQKKSRDALPVTPLVSKRANVRVRQHHDCPRLLTTSLPFFCGRCTQIGRDKQLSVITQAKTWTTFSSKKRFYNDIIDGHN